MIQFSALTGTSTVCPSVVDDLISTLTFDREPILYIIFILSKITYLTASTIMIRKKSIVKHIPILF